MLEHMKNHHIEEATFIGPDSALAKLRAYAKELGVKELEESVPWRDAMPEATTGFILRGARLKEGMTQKELAERTGIPQSHISAMENDKMSIGKERARRLAKALNVDYRIFL